ncbi:MAG: hypothetical protein TUN42_06660 [Dehalogenimonas sp.]
MVPNVRIDEQNYRRLQKFAIPFEDTPNDTLGRVLGLAELAKQKGLSLGCNEISHSADLVVERLDIKLAKRLSNIAKQAKIGKTMTRWELTKNGTRFWLTTRGVALMLLPSRVSWGSDTEHKIIHFTAPKTGWQHYDHLYLRNDSDVDYALKIIGDL